MTGSSRHLAAALLALAVFTLSSAEGADRLRVTAPPPGQEAAEQLVGSLAASCNSGDFVAFMDHFTPSHGQKIRGRMEDVFVKHQPRMDIYQVTLLSEQDDTITFGVKYAWHDKEKPEEVVASKVTARKIDGQWKLDGEKVKSAARTASDSAYSSGNAAPAAWNAFDPPANLISPHLEHLRGDIGIQPGFGCADGRCRAR